MTSTVDGLANDCTEHIGATPADRGRADALKNLAYAAVQPLLYWGLYLKILGDLAPLDDDVLHDVGLTRWDVDSYARNRAALRWPARHSARALLVEVAAALSRALKRGRERRMTINDLLRLDDRMLKDIGLSRSQIPWVAHAMVQTLSRPDWAGLERPETAPDTVTVEPATNSGKRPSYALMPSGADSSPRRTTPANDGPMLKAS